MSYLAIGILILVGIFWGLQALFEAIGKATKETSARLSVDKSKNIIERNNEIIQKHLSQIYAKERAYYIENEVRDCIGVIAQREGLSDLVPKYREWLSDWEQRSDLPKEYVQLKDHLKLIFSTKHKELIEKEQNEQEVRVKEHKDLIASQGEKILTRNQDLISKFLEIAERKVSFIDEYGDESWEELSDEILACIKKLFFKEGIEINWKEYGKGRLFFQTENLEKIHYLKNRLEEMFRDYHGKQKTTLTEELNELSGVEFETHLVKILKSNGYEDIRGTPGSGDQGADLIAKKDGKTIIIQAKRYQGPVSNKAVQEVISALSYYGGDEGWVITNSSFTTSAKALAQKGKIKLIDGNSLKNIKNYL
ncbi:MAG: restriction endonuclease [Candidatus Omnitrophica bacterium]|nr:restriction endonuclease [Candidatus Omnitrophota bacterium]